MTKDHSDPTRREFLQQGALSGVAMVALPGLHPHLLPMGYLPEARAKAVIHIFLSGGLSQHCIAGAVRAPTGIMSDPMSQEGRNEPLKDGET